MHCPGFDQKCCRVFWMQLMPFSKRPSFAFSDSLSDGDEGDDEVDDCDGEEDCEGVVVVEGFTEI